eukprot:COSAG01_NODE_6057_length_3876_cov_2.004766_4_plen_121_part_00
MGYPQEAGGRAARAAGGLVSLNGRMAGGHQGGGDSLRWRFVDILLYGWLPAPGRVRWTRRSAAWSYGRLLARCITDVPSAAMLVRYRCTWLVIFCRSTFAQRRSTPTPLLSIATHWAPSL